MARRSQEKDVSPKKAGSLDKYPGRRRTPRERRSEEEEKERKTGPSPIAIIAATAIVIVIIAIILLAFFNQGGIEKIYLGNQDVYYGDDIYPEGLYYPIIASSDSVSSAEGTATVKVTYDEDTNDEVLFEKEVKIKDDTGSVEIPFRDFVIANGNYTIRIEAEGTSDEKIYQVKDVVEKLKMEWQDNRSESSSFNDIHEVTLMVIPLDSNGNRLRAYPSPFHFQGVLITPSGDQRSIRFDTLGSTFSHYSMTLDHKMKGEYRLTGSWTNEMCIDSSPYRIIGISSNNTYTVDAKPAAHAGDPQTVQLEGDQVEVTLDGSRSWDDGMIVQYLWDFGDGTNQTTQTPTVTHSYTEEGEYLVELVVVDDDGKRSSASTESLIYIIVE